MILGWIVKNSFQDKAPYHLSPRSATGRQRYHSVFMHALGHRASIQIRTILLKNLSLNAQQYFFMRVAIHFACVCKSVGAYMHTLITCAQDTEASFAQDQGFVFKDFVGMVLPLGCRASVRG